MNSRPASVDVCVCTFRRESVADTLRSLARQVVGPGMTLRAIVADNDSEPSAEARVRRLAEEAALSVHYLHAPERNISVARNAALEAATADWVAFIDDDEIADPGWIAALLAMAGETGAEVVLGPVCPSYTPEAPDWLREGDFLSTEPTWRGGRIVEGYTSNALLRRGAEAAAGERFDEALGRSGGEDTEFFDRLLAKGARIAYAPDAVVREDVPPDRQTLRWLLRRRYRFGQTHGMLLARRAGGKPTARGRAIVLAGAKAAVSGVGAALTVLRPSRRTFWMLRCALHLGAVARLVGQAELVQYGGGRVLRSRDCGAP